ncbi:MAG: glycine/betaine/sarcosine/D-proline family reductase selenoprotein B, partial [Syntrophales bacterium]|nr:glycine/betaine/sarcosine/D-proline family reductase selenoprotein B [Syntrophales bacterium]
MERQIRVVHYLNQFFGQIGGEDKAGVGFSVVNGPVGPGVLLQKLLGDKGIVAATVICGDNYFTRDTEKAVEEGLKLIAEFTPDIFISGPAFFAGRYGVACAAMADAVREQLKIPVLTGMYADNPAVDMVRKKMYVVSTGNSAGTMADAMKKIVALAGKLAAKEPIGKPEAEGYLPQGFVRNEFQEKTGAERAIDMLMAKLAGEPFATELTLPVFEEISPAPKVADLKSTIVALVSDGGLIPKANPDKFRVSQNTVFAGY